MSGFIPEGCKLFYEYECAGCKLRYKVSELIKMISCPRCLCSTSRFINNEIEECHQHQPKEQSQ